MRRVLLIAYHFPPLTQSSGIQRTLRFAQYLPDFGWDPVVLTVSPIAYENPDPSAHSLIPSGCKVIRFPCLDSARHLSWRGRYFRSLALPDRWTSWGWYARVAGARLCRNEGIDLIWSTYPIATAHLIGGLLAKRTGLPWVADFRDPMVQPGYPEDPRQRAAFARIENTVATTAGALVFTTSSACATYRNRFPQVAPERFAVLENGYDELTFAGPEREARLRHRAGDACADTKTPVILHSGIVYPSERNPVPLFTALGNLKRSGSIKQGDFIIRFRAAVHEGMLRALVIQEGLEDLVEIQPPTSYKAAVTEMLDAQVLLVLQAENCNEQIPAKLYEYLRAGRPILGLATPAGETGRKLLELGFPDVVPLESAEQIAGALMRCLSSLRSGSAYRAPKEAVAAYSRQHLTGGLAAIFDLLDLDHPSPSLNP